jgi:hypothetical protein
MSDRSLPSNVYRLPTFMLTFDKDGIITKKYGFNEQTGSVVDIRMFPSLAVEGFLSNKPVVMPLSLEDSSGNLHCNAIVIMNSQIERFEPRGNIHDERNTSMVNSFYDPTHLDITLSRTIKSWFSTRNFNLSNVIRGKARNDVLPPYFRYRKPRSTGIFSTDMDTYKNASHCSTLTFNYLRIRVNTQFRTEAYKKWLSYEKNVGVNA